MLVSFDNLLEKFTLITFRVNEGLGRISFCDETLISLLDDLNNEEHSKLLLKEYYGILKSYEKTFYEDALSEMKKIPKKEDRWLYLNEYIERIQASGLESEVIEAIEVVVNDEPIVYDDLDENFKKFISNLIKINKEIIPEVIKELKAYKVNLTQIIHSDDIENAEKLNHKEIKRKDITSFNWSNNSAQELNDLYTLIQGKIIDCDKETFFRAFDGKKIEKSLRIKWILKGRNKESNIKAIFSFLKQLHNFGRIKEFVNYKNPKRNENSAFYESVVDIFCHHNGKTISRTTIRNKSSQYNDYDNNEEINNLIIEFQKSLPS